MFKSNSKLPKFFIYMMTPLAIMMFVGAFFGIGYVRLAYFVALIVCVIFLVIDKKVVSSLTNYKIAYLLFEIVNLIAIFSIIYYEYALHSKLLNIFLIMLAIVEIVMCIVDVVVLKNKNLNKKTNIFVDIMKLGSMICVLTYFFGVSELYYAIFAFAFEFANVTAKIITLLNDKNTDYKDLKDSEERLEDLIHSNDGEEVGE